MLAPPANLQQALYLASLALGRSSSPSVPLSFGLAWMAPRIPPALLSARFDTPTDYTKCTTIPTLLNNALGQTPCEVYDTLLFSPQCSGFSGANDGTTGTLNCYCSTVIYYLASACKACQGSPWQTWDNWGDACPPELTPLTIGHLPVSMPLNASVPGWAMLDAAHDFSLNATERIISMSLPDSGPTMTLGLWPITSLAPLPASPTSPTSSASSSSSSSSSSSNTPADPGSPFHSSITHPPSTPVYAEQTFYQTFLWQADTGRVVPTGAPDFQAPHQPSSRPPLAPLIGGTVGGALFLLFLLACLVYLFLRRRRCRQDQSFDTRTACPSPLLPCSMPDPYPYPPTGDTPFAAYRLPPPTPTSRPLVSSPPQTGPPSSYRGGTPPPEYSDLSRLGSLRVPGGSGGSEGTGGGTRADAPVPAEGESERRHRGGVDEHPRGGKTPWHAGR